MLRMRCRMSTNMDLSIHIWIGCTCLFLSFSNVLTFAGMLDIEEINNIDYGIDILKEPVLLKTEDELPVNHIHLTSKFGQRYQCYFPDQIESEKKTEEKEKEALETGIPELLKPLETGPCLLKAKDWWSYEFCYGKYIRQFHLEDGRMLGDIIYLGYFEAEKKWAEEEEPNERLNRYHSQSYVNGSKCDLTGNQRKTEVRFVCDEGAGDHIGRIDEPETCSYVMTVHTNKICHHPYLKPFKQAQAVPITCNPVLDEEQYNEYQQMVEEEKEKKRLEEEERKRQLEEKKLRYSEDETLADDEGFKVINDDGSVTYMDSNGEPKTSSSSLTDSLKDAELKVKVQVIDSVEELERVFKDLKKLEIAGGKVPLDSNMVDKDKSKDISTEGKDGNVAPEEDVTEDLSSHDKTTLTFEKSKPKDKSKSMVSEVVEDLDSTEEDEKSPAEETFSKADDSTDDEKHDEIDEEMKDLMDDFDKGLEEASKHSDLKSRLQRNKESLSELQSQVKDAVRDELDNIINEAEEEVGVNLEDRKKSYKHLTQTLDNLMKRLDNTQEEIDKVDKHIEEVTEDITTKDGLDLKDNIKGPDKDDDRVKVRVTRVNRKDLPKTEEKGSDLDSVENQLKDELEKAGLDLAGGKVQVKIITAGYYDKKGEPIKTLTAQDSDAFKDMITSILGGDHEAAEEANKHEEQEENYSFVWGGKDKKMPLS